MTTLSALQIAKAIVATNCHNAPEVLRHLTALEALVEAQQLISQKEPQK